MLWNILRCIYMKKIIYLLSGIILFSCLFCACFKQNNDQTIDPETDEYLSVSLPISRFAYGTDVSVSISIGVSESFISQYQGREQALLVISTKENFDILDKNTYILSTIIDFYPYIWERSNDDIVYNFSREYVIPQSIFTEISGEFYCMFLLFPLSIESYTSEQVTFSTCCPILYKKHENEIVLKLVYKK